MTRIAAALLLAASTASAAPRAVVDGSWWSSGEVRPLTPTAWLTETGARLCHMADDAGSLAPGKLADLIVVDGDPLADIGLLGADGKHVSAIMARGRFFKNELGGTQ